MSILDLIGNTPIANLAKISPNKNVRIFAKLEGNNPSGSVKDRAAYFMVNAAEETGVLT